MIEWIKGLPNHPAELLSVTILIVIIAYFMMKKLLKLVLILFLILIAICGYYYYKGQDKSPAGIRQAIVKTKEKTEGFIEKSKSAYEKGVEVVAKGKRMSEGVNKMLDLTKEDQKTPSRKETNKKTSKAD